MQSSLKTKLEGRKPEFGIVLGSGLGDLAQAIEKPAIINYNDIPHFPLPTAPEIIAARNRGMKTVAFSWITNTIAADGTYATNHEKIVRILGSPKVKERLTGTVRNFFWLYK